MPVKKDFIVQRQGKDFVLYAGLLDLAHENGLISLHSEILQFPTAENNQTAYARAVATFERDGAIRTFEDFAEANKTNVGSAMANCLPRMASTRAKARALRDGVNIGAAAFEELGEEDEEGLHAGPAAAKSTARPAATPRPAAAQPAASAEDGNSRKDAYHALIEMTDPPFPVFVDRAALEQLPPGPQRAARKRAMEATRDAYIISCAGRKPGAVLTALTAQDFITAAEEHRARVAAEAHWNTARDARFQDAPELDKELVLIRKMGVPVESKLFITSAQWKALAEKLPDFLDRVEAQQKHQQQLREASQAA